MKDKIEIIYSKEDNAFKVVNGTVDLGYIGVYNTENITVEFDMDDLYSNHYSNNYYEENFKPLEKYLHKDMNNDEIAKGLEDFYNDRINDICKHQIELNQLFLIHLLESDCGCAFPFWENCSDYIIKDQMPDCDEDDLENVIYNNNAINEINNIFYEIDKKHNDGEICNLKPVEDIYKKYFPMFDLNKFLSDIQGEYLYLNGANITFQCSGKGQALEIACGAYAEITIYNSFYDWHNH